jgi:ABC-type lipoprotein export system ATPase subunit
VSPPQKSVLGIRDLQCVRGLLTVRAGELEFTRGTLHLLRGEASSGHELLLRVLGLLELPETGEVFLEGNATRGLTDDARLKLREQRLGFVFTAPFLLPAFTVIENVAMPLFKISEVEPNEARLRSEVLIELVGLADFSSTPCADLSPLQQHRTALSRALVNEPAAVLIENLDTALADEELRLFAMLLRLAASRLGVAVIATVSPAFAGANGDRVIEVADGFATAPEVLPRTDA